MYTSLGHPGIFRNDRFWLAGDHVVDSCVNALPQVRTLTDASERAWRIFKMTDYQGMNVSIFVILPIYLFISLYSDVSRGVNQRSTQSYTPNYTAKEHSPGCLSSAPTRTPVHLGHSVV